MNIIFGKSQVESLPENKFIVLELDQIQYGESRPDRAYCVVEHVPIVELPDVEHNSELHKQLMLSYRQREWQNCYNLIDGLRGKWGGELDSFYNDLYQRVQQLEPQELDKSWAGIITKEV